MAKSPLSGEASRVAIMYSVAFNVRHEQGLKRVKGKQETINLRPLDEGNQPSRNFSASVSSLSRWPTRSLILERSSSSVLLVAVTISRRLLLSLRLSCQKLSRHGSSGVCTSARKDGPKVCTSARKEGPKVCVQALARRDRRFVYTRRQGGVCTSARKDGPKVCVQAHTRRDRRCVHAQARRDRRCVYKCTHGVSENGDKEREKKESKGRK